ncbi:hypothetical protein GCM10009624_33260 [Gordonia sinesedis]
MYGPLSCTNPVPGPRLPTMPHVGFLGTPNPHISPPSHQAWTSYVTKASLVVVNNIGTGLSGRRHGDATRRKIITK